MRLGGEMPLVDLHPLPSVHIYSTPESRVGVFGPVKGGPI